MEFIPEYYPPNAVPHTVSIRPILRAGQRAPLPLEGARQIADALRYYTVQRIQNFRAWTPQRIGQIFGAIQGFNIGDGTIHSYDEIPRLAAIDARVIMDIFVRIQESNMALGLYDLEWTFIIPLETFIVGGKSVRPPRWANNIQLRDTWLDHGVNCAAYSLVRLMELTKPRPRNPNRSQPQFVIEAKQLCLDLGWTDQVTFAELVKFVEKFHCCFTCCSAQFFE